MKPEEYERLQARLTSLQNKKERQPGSGSSWRDGWRDAIMAVKSMVHSEFKTKSPWIPVSKKLPENTDPVNVTWINRNPQPYYESIKDKPFTGTAHYCRGRWWWDSPVCKDYLDEYGKSPCDDIHPDIEITAWQPLPEPYKEATNEID